MKTELTKKQKVTEISHIFLIDFTINENPRQSRGFSLISVVCV